MFRRYSLAGLAVALLCIAPRYLPRPYAPGVFGLVYVYEANSHNDGDIRATLTRMNAQAIAFDGENVRVSRGEKPSFLTSIYLIYESTSTGHPVDLRAVSSAGRRVNLPVGKSGSRSSLFGGRALTIECFGDGSVSASIAGVSRHLADGDNFALLAYQSEGALTISEETTSLMASLRSADRKDEPISRLVIVNYGKWDLARVRGPHE